MSDIKLSGELQALASRLQAGGGSVRGALYAGAAAVKTAVQDYYRSISRRGFYASRVADSRVQMRVHEAWAEVIIDSPELVHKITGGDVYPRAPRQNLAIPLTEEARAAGSPANRRIKGVFRPGHVKGRPNSGARVLAVKDGAGFRALWALVPKVTHRPDPRARVPEALLSAAAEGAMRAELLRALKI